MKQKLGLVLITLVLLIIMVGCSAQQIEAEPEVVWDTLSPEEQRIEITVTDIAREQLESDWVKKSSNTALFMLIQGSS